jgi:uncharacterized membrane protein
MLAYNFFTDEEKKRIAEAIRTAELETSGEICLHVEGNCKVDVLDCAAYWFKKLNMHQTALRNGVLFYLAVNDHKFAIIGDAGINSKVPDDFWENIKEHMRLKFKEGLFADALVDGILMAGDQLKTHFPYQNGDINELSDDISFG